MEPEVKNLPDNAGDARDTGLIPRLGRSPEGGNGNTLQPGKPHGWSGLAGYSPWRHKESGRTERTHTRTHTHKRRKQRLYIVKG